MFWVSKFEHGKNNTPMVFRVKTYSKSIIFRRNLIETANRISDAFSWDIRVDIISRIFEAAFFDHAFSMKFDDFSSFVNRMTSFS